MTITALVLAVASLLGRGQPSPTVTRAIAKACTEEASRGPVDVEMCAALMVVYGGHESSWRPVYGDSGRSFGYWQEPAAVATRLDALGQARYWLATLRRGTLAGLDSSPSRAARRVRLAEGLLATARAGVVERRGR